MRHHVVHLQSAGHRATVTRTVPVDQSIAAAPSRVSTTASTASPSHETGYEAFLTLIGKAKQGEIEVTIFSTATSSPRLRDLAKPTAPPMRAARGGATRMISSPSACAPQTSPGRCAECKSHVKSSDPRRPAGQSTRDKRLERCIAHSDTRTPVRIN